MERTNPIPYDSPYNSFWPYNSNSERRPSSHLWLIGANQICQHCAAFFTCLNGPRWIDYHCAQFWGADSTALCEIGKPVLTDWELMDVLVISYLRVFSGSNQTWSMVLSGRKRSRCFANWPSVWEKNYQWCPALTRHPIFFSAVLASFLSLSRS